MRTGKEISTIVTSKASSVGGSLLADILVLFKHRLSLTVVLTSVFGYLIASGLTIDISSFLRLFVGGFLVTGAANAMNQILEKDFDALMNRTQGRPIPQGRLKMSEALLYTGISLMIGIFILASFNPVTALMGMIAFVSYSFIYTPLKRYHTAAVAVGAVPGALPVLIGCTAFEAYISGLAIFLFAIQFLWQFPHFWSIGFLSFVDYKNAGFKFLPADENGNAHRSLALNSVIYSLMMIPVLIVYVYANVVPLLSVILLLMLVVTYIFLSYQFYEKFERQSAKLLMFFSFFFMPLFLIILMVF